jgi:hypothetical protein
LLVQIKVQHIHSLEVLNRNLMVVIYIKILQKVLHIHVVHLVWHVEVLEDQLYHVFDLFASQVSVVTLVENVKQHFYWHDDLLELRLLRR